MVYVRHHLFFAATVAVALLAAGNAAGAEPVAQAKTKKISAGQIKAFVESHLRKDPTYRPGDLLTRAHVEPIFNDLVDMGIEPIENGEELFDKFLPDNYYLALLLRSPQGRVFMRAVADIPHVYDRLERLAWSPIGRQWLMQLTTAADGPEQLKRLLTPAGLKAVAAQLQDERLAELLELPSGKIHTEQELIERLQTLVDSSSSKKRSTGDRKPPKG